MFLRFRIWQSYIQVLTKLMIILLNDIVHLLSENMQQINYYVA